jgi:pimeloyl-ACP methyl ester carboxylesterase
VAGLLVVALCGGCSAGAHRSIRIDPGDGSELRVAGVDACDDFASPATDLDPAKPLVLLVHGCKSSSGRFRHLAAIFEAHGQQALCFNYGYRDRIASGAEALARALGALAKRLDRPEVTVIGHSQGGLVARRAVVAGGGRQGEPTGRPRLRLVTVSSPFNGIQASSHCGITALHLLSLGIVTAICQGIAGSNWSEINPHSDFVTEPGDLFDSVSEHLMIVTDERKSCRVVSSDGRCLEDDYVFSLEEQHNARLFDDPRLVDIEVRAGHAAIVGDENRPPRLLMAVLQEHGIMNPTPPDRETEVQALLGRLY